MQINVLIKEECILKNKNKSCPYKKLSAFYNSVLKLLGLTLYNIAQPDGSTLMDEINDWFAL